MMALLIRISLLIAIFTAVGAAQSTIRAALQPAAGRKPAAEFTLRDADGKEATLKQYRGKVLLLDFWATWCTGCKIEIPWFVEFQKKFGARGLAVVGVSLDDGWAVLKPFLEKTPIPYRMLLGDQATAQRYGIRSMPDTFLIDRQGRVAAAYLGAIVDKEDVERNLERLLAEK